MTNHSCAFKSENGGMKVIMGSLIVMKGIRMKSLYILQAKIVVGGTDIVHEKQDKSSL